MQATRLREPYTAETTGIFAAKVSPVEGYDTDRVCGWFNLLRQDYNLMASLDAAGQLQESLAAERERRFGALLVDPECRPLFRANQRVYRRRRMKANGPLRQKSERRFAAIPAAGCLRDVLQHALEAGRGPEGYSIDQVVKATWRREQNGRFVCYVHLQGAPTTPDLWAWAKDMARPTHAVDMGCTITPEGLQVTVQQIRQKLIHQVIKDQPWRKLLLGSVLGGSICSTDDFRVDDPKRKPKQFVLPAEMLLHPDFAADFWNTISERYRIRTVGVDTSMLGSVSPELARAYSVFIRRSRKRIAEDAGTFRVVTTVGRECREHRDYLAEHIPGLSGWELRRAATQVPMTCPHCRQTFILKVDHDTGLPTSNHQRCECCRRQVDVGFLLAERAAAQAVHGWEQDIAPIHFHLGIDPRKQAKQFKTSAVEKTTNESKRTAQSSRNQAGPRIPQNSTVRRRPGYQHDFNTSVDGQPPSVTPGKCGRATPANDTPTREQDHQVGPRIPQSSSARAGSSRSYNPETHTKTGVLRVRKNPDYTDRQRLLGISGPLRLPGLLSRPHTA